MWVLLLSCLWAARSQACVVVVRGRATVQARVGGEARMHAVFVCAQSPLQNSGGEGLVSRDRLADQDMESGGEAVEAKRGVILSATLVSWEVDQERLLLPSRVVLSLMHVSLRVQTRIC